MDRPKDQQTAVYTDQSIDIQLYRQTNLQIDKHTDSHILIETNG